MEGIFTQSRLKIVFFSRLFYYLLTLLCTYECEPYDTSNILYNVLYNNKFVEGKVWIVVILNFKIFESFIKLGWSVFIISSYFLSHFLAIAKSGYLYEQQHAFLPLFPFIIRSVAYYSYFIKI